MSQTGLPKDFDQRTGFDKAVQRENELYIGDGVYVSFDGFQLWLRTPRADGDHEIALEPEVYAALVEYIGRLKVAGK